MTDSVKQYIGVLIDRICELEIENRILKEMHRDPAVLGGAYWEDVLKLSLCSPESHAMRQRFAERRDEVLKRLHRDEDIEAMLKLPTRGLPN